MKKTFIIVFTFLLACFKTNAQTNLFGVTTFGGQYDRGTIWTANADGSNLNAAYSFNNGEARCPTGNLIQAANGWLYGVSKGYISTSGSIVFKYNPATGVYVSLHDFASNEPMGQHPLSGMCQMSDGNLYGLTQGGGANGVGVIYKVNPTNDTYTKVFDFTMSSGLSGPGSLVEANNKLFGQTYQGGINGTGVIFSFEPSTSTYLKLYDYPSGSGNGFEKNFLLATDGKLYSTSYDSIHGSIFSFDPNTNIYTNLHNFNGVNGSAPNSGLIQATNGKLYGMTKNGGGGSPSKGVIYSYDIATDVYTDLFHFTTNSGYNPNRRFMQGSNGLLYGVAIVGGANNNGTFFSFDINTNTFTKLHDFLLSTTGNKPDGEIIEFTPTTTNMGNLNSTKSISISPNPATDFVIITNQSEQEQIQFIDVLGKEIATIKVSANGQTKVDVSQFPNLFFVRINGELKKIVRN